MNTLQPQEGSFPLLNRSLPEIEGEYTGDGSLDINGKPAKKHFTGNWKACVSILVAEFGVCLAENGFSQNLVTYLTTVLHESNVVAARNVSIWQATSFLTPLFGAFVADSRWGRYRTIVVSCSISVVGMILATLSASFQNFRSGSFLNSKLLKAFSAQEVMLFFGLYMMAMGSGGVRTSVVPFGAGQFDDTDTSEIIKKASFFNWYFFTVKSGSVISSIVLVWVQDHYGWTIGFGIPAVLMGIALANFLVCSKRYRFQKTGESPLTRICQVVVASTHKFNLDVPSDSSHLYELPGNASTIEGSRKLGHTAGLKFFDRAAIVPVCNDESCVMQRNPWRLCTVTQVEELKILARMLPIWATVVFFYAVSAQVFSTFVEQGMVMENRIGSFNIPPASLSTFDVLTIVILVPVYDRVFVPIARRFSRKQRGISELFRVGIGLFTPVIVMTSAALVETKRLEIARAKGLTDHTGTVPMSILWQVPQYFLVGLGEVFTTVGLLEFFYDQAPVTMRSICISFVFLAISMGTYLSSFILSMVSLITARGGAPGWIPDNLNEGNLDRFFWLMAGLSCLNLMGFAYCSMSKTKRLGKSTSGAKEWAVNSSFLHKLELQGYGE